MKSDFSKCVNICEVDGSTYIYCKMGLWNVQAASRIKAINEAAHYFNQYKEDGEYDRIIGEKPPKLSVECRVRKGYIPRGSGVHTVTKGNCDNCDKEEKIFPERHFKKDDK